MVTGAYIIRHHRPYRCLLAVLIAAVAVAVGVWAYLDAAHRNERAALSALQSGHARLQAENRELERQARQISEDFGQQGQLLAMQQATSEQLQNELHDLQNKVIELNRELLFYQNITQGNASSELQVRELYLRVADDVAGQFHYRIVITQGERITKPIEGTVKLTLNLHDDSAPTRDVGEHSLNLRHVQVLEGSVKLTDNEQPASLHVQLIQGNKTLAQRTFDWEVEASPSVTR